MIKWDGVGVIYMIYILFIITTLFLCIAYKGSRLKFLSPTFWASSLFVLCTFIYCITFFSMNSDISLQTLLVIVTFLIVTYIGEYIGMTMNVTIKRNSGRNRKLKNILQATKYSTIEIPFWKILLLTIIYLYIAIKRYINLAAVVGNKDAGLLNIFSIMGDARTKFIKTNGKIVLGNVIENQIVYFSEITTYIVLFIFIYNSFCARKRKYYILLPLVPDLIIRMISTSRTSFIILMFSILIFIIVIQYKKNNFKKIKIPKRFVVLGIIFIIAFFVYGRFRNNIYSIPIVSYIQSYTSASIYGLDYLLINGWTKNSYFGKNTMYHILDFIGIENANPQMGSGMVTFSKSTLRSNLITSLMPPIMDFGIWGMLLLRFIAALLSTVLIKKFLSYVGSGSYKTYILIYFVVAVLYAYLLSPIGDSFRDYFFNPDLMFRYLVYGFLLVKCFLQPRIVEKDISFLRSES